MKTLFSTDLLFSFLFVLLSYVLVLISPLTFNDFNKQFELLKYVHFKYLSGYFL